MGFGSWRCSPIWSVFTHAEFYGAPILLEEVSDPILLGVHVDTDQRTTTVRFHHDMSHYRSSISQGSDLALSSAFAARLLMSSDTHTQNRWSFLKFKIFVLLRCAPD